MKYYSIGEFSKPIGKNSQTGCRYYSQEQLNHFLGIKGIETKTKKVIGIVELVHINKKMTLKGK